MPAWLANVLVKLGRVQVQVQVEILSQVKVQQVQQVQQVHVHITTVPGQTNASTPASELVNV